MADWFAVFNTTTGELVSVGTVVASSADLTARGLSSSFIGTSQPDFNSVRWNTGTRALEAFTPPPDPRQPLRDKDTSTWTNTDIAQALKFLLGG